METLPCVAEITGVFLSPERSDHLPLDTPNSPSCVTSSTMSTLRSSDGPLLANVLLEMIVPCRIPPERALSYMQYSALNAGEIWDDEECTCWATLEYETCGPRMWSDPWSSSSVQYVSPVSLLAWWNLALCENPCPPKMVHVGVRVRDGTTLYELLR